MFVISNKQPVVITWFKLLCIYCHLKNVKHFALYTLWNGWCRYGPYTDLNYKWMRKCKYQTTVYPGQVHLHAIDSCLHVETRDFIILAFFRSLPPSGGSSKRRLTLHTCIIRVYNHVYTVYYHRYDPFHPRRADVSPAHARRDAGEYPQRPLPETMTEILVLISATAPSSARCRPKLQVLWITSSEKRKNINGLNELNKRYTRSRA